MMLIIAWFEMCKEVRLRCIFYMNITEMNSQFPALDKGCVLGRPPTESWDPLCERRAR